MRRRTFGFAAMGAPVSLSWGGAVGGRTAAWIVLSTVLAGVGGCATGHARPGREWRGMASYYSDRLAGRSTASGEPYRPERLTAAHRTLPFGTRVRVTNRRNGRSVVVRINDRGPFGRRRRIIDVSRRAARQLRMIRAGVVPVTVELVSPRRRR